MADNTNPATYLGYYVGITDNTPENALAVFREFILNYDIYFINNTYFYLKDTGGFEQVNEATMKRHRMISDQPHFPKSKAYIQFIRAIHNNERVRKEVVVSAKAENQDSDTVLNLFEPGNFVIPKQTGKEVHPLLRAIMKGISNGNIEIEEHIARSTLRLIRFPDQSSQIPALCFYGAGGAGKNLFAGRILKTVFGEKNTTSGTYGDLFGKYNDLLEHKIIIHVDENKADKRKTEKLKSIVSSPTVNVAKKWCNTNRNENLAWYIFSTNHSHSPITFNGDERVDRRWSLIKLDNPLEYYLPQIGVNGITRTNIRDYIVTNDKALDDGDMIAQMLWEYEQLYPDVYEKSPVEWHDHNYYELVAVTASFEKIFFDAVIDCELFGSIPNREAYDFYVDSGGKITKIDFGRKFMEYLNERKIRISGMQGGRWRAVLGRSFITFAKGKKKNGSLKGWPFSLDELVSISEESKIIKSETPHPVRQFSQHIRSRFRAN